MARNRDRGRRIAPAWSRADVRDAAPAPADAPPAEPGPPPPAADAAPETPLPENPMPDEAGAQVAAPPPVDTPDKPAPAAPGVRVKFLRCYWPIDGRGRCHTGSEAVLPTKEALAVLNSGVATRADKLTEEDL